jgi:hypothetical protein
MLVGDPTAAAALGGALQVRALFSKYEKVKESVISDYLSSIPEGFSEAVEKVAAFQGPTVGTDFVLNNRAKMQILVEKFHREAGTLTSGISKILGLLSDPRTIFFVSVHQPNLFPYGGVFKKIVLLQTLKRALEERKSDVRIINFFLIVDHDFMDDLYIRMAELPSIRHSDGRLELRIPLNESKRWQLVCNMPLPGRTVVDSWRSQIYSWIRNSLSSLPASTDKSVVMDNFEDFWRLVEHSYSRSKSYSDFNSFLISQFVNMEWGYDTLFVRLSEMSPVFEDGFNFLICNFARYSSTLNKTEKMFLRCGIDTGVSPTSYLNAPLWLHCSCGSKGSTRVQKDGQGQMLLVGNCISCKRELKVVLGKQGRMMIPTDRLSDLSPRAIPILVLLSRDLGVTCYASGTGGSTGYALVGLMLFKEFSLKMPTTVVWTSRDVYRGIGQAESLEILKVSRELDITNYIDILKQREFEYKNKIDPLITERTRLVKNAESIDLVLSNIFKLKQEQRKIRELSRMAEKVKNAIETKASIIDYAINFGIANTEILWRRHLLENDNLAAPLVMPL